MLINKELHSLPNLVASRVAGGFMWIETYRWDITEWPLSWQGNYTGRIIIIIVIISYQCRTGTRTCSLESNSWLDGCPGPPSPKRVRTCQIGFLFNPSRTGTFSSASYPLKYLIKVGHHFRNRFCWFLRMPSALCGSPCSGNRDMISSSQRDSSGDARWGESMREAVSR